MQYTLIIQESEQGFAVSVPGLPGCHPQDDTEAEAIREYLQAARELAESANGKVVQVSI